MKQTILKIFIPILTLLPAVTFVAPVYAAPCGNTPAAQQVSTGIDQTTAASCNDSGVGSAISLAVNILTFIVGAAAVIALIWSGFKYITSGGDTNKVANAKSTLIYALIGIAVVGLTQILIHFVLSAAGSVTTPCPYTISGHPDITVNDPLCKKP
jgi:hypothetical protein